MNAESENPIRVMGIHSLTYCKRLYYLEEVEGILIADDRVYEGRNFHDQIRIDNNDINRVETFEYTSEILGLTGKVDRLQKRDGQWIPYEYKKGRSKSDGNQRLAWDSDILQVVAYALLIEEQSGRIIEEARIKYNKDNVLIKILITEELRDLTKQAILQAERLTKQTKRPPVSSNPNICIRCSLAPVCLPEENRVIEDDSYDSIRLFPPKREKQTIHVTGYKSSLHKNGETLVVETLGDSLKSEKIKIPLNEIDSIVLHGGVQISTQLITMLSYHHIPIHWFSSGGSYVASINSNSGNIQRKIRQYEALVDEKFRLYLTKRLVLAKCESQLRYLLRASRKNKRTIFQLESINKIRNLISNINTCENIDSVRGYEGSVAKVYHQFIPMLLIETVPNEMIPNGRSKRPPKDRYNAIQSFLYALLYKSVYQAIIVVGLEESLGFYHTPRSSASPLTLDIMELFRTSICDIPLIGSVNRLTWETKKDFEVTKEKVWLSKSGREKAIRIFEERLNDTWKHPITHYSLSYYRMIELEIRLLEKEWNDNPGLFAKSRLR